MTDHFEATLTEADSKRYIRHTFTVPAGCVGLDLTLNYAPVRVASYGNLLCLTLFDPAASESGAFRGAGHRGGAPQTVHLGPDWATPGYLPGPLPPGEWTAEIDTHMVLPGQPVHYTLDVTTEKDARTEKRMHTPADAPRSETPAPRGAGWYRGDLHTHTVHSDGDFTVAGLLQASEARGLDFLFLSDHNTVSGLAEFSTLPSPLLRLPALELTTFWGHALCLGTRQWVDWRVRRDTHDMAQLAEHVAADGLLFIIAHPRSAGDPGCTGCAWLYGDVWPGPARFVEVWNGPWDGDSGNEGNLALWYQWLNEGRHMIATAGTDSHGPHDDTHALGYPVVYAETLSEAGVLDAIRRGHLYLSSGPQLRLTATGADGALAMMGDVVAGQQVTVHAAWDACPPGVTLRLIVNGVVYEAWLAGNTGSRAWMLDTGHDHWCSLELRGPAGEILALTNPVFLEVPSPIAQ
jgi:hypothetical protein